MRASAPLYLSMVTTLLGSLVVTATLGRHATVTLAAFAVMTAVLTPAATAVAGALRGLAPFVAPHRDDPDAVVPVLRDARWLSLFTGLAGAPAVLAVPALAAAAGVPDMVPNPLYKALCEAEQRLAHSSRTRPARSSSPTESSTPARSGSAPRRNSSTPNWSFTALVSFVPATA